MNVILFVLAFAILITTSILNAKQEVKYKIKGNLSLITFSGGAIFCILMLISLDIINAKQIKAIDVYRGKTELRIEGYYQDSVFVVTDSIVVYKKK